MPASPYIENAKTTIPEPAGLRMIGLTRKSKDGSGGSHEDQRALIEARAAAEGFTLLRIEREHAVSGAKDWRKREAGRAIEAIRRGEADGIIVAYQDRITRERLLAGAEIWQALEDAGAVFVACDGTDSRQEGSEMMFTIKAAVAREQWKVYQRRSNDGRARAVEMGVHGGDTPPLGYVFTKRTDGSKNTSGKAKHGPLAPSADAGKVKQAFERFGAAEDWASWSEIVSILGVKSNGNARAILTNRVYLGTAYSGEFEKEGAHEALVSEEVFERVARRLGTQAEEFAGRVQQRRSHTVQVLSKVLRCAECGNVLSPHRTKRNGNVYVAWRCNRGLVGVCAGMGSVADTDLTTFALGHAQAWHALDHASWTLSKEVNDATLPVLEQAVIEAQAEVFRLESEIGAGLPATAKQKMAVEQARAAIQEHEASRGWIARTPEQVAEALDGADAETLNSFLRDTVRIIVKRGPGPRAKKEQRAVENRVQVLQLTAGRTAGNESPESLIPLPVPNVSAASEGLSA